MTPAEQEEFLAPIRAKAEQESKAMLQAAAQEDSALPPVEACPLQGVIDPLTPDVIRPFHDWEFIISDYWGGTVNGECLGVYAGYDPAKPLQGELVVWNLSNGEPWQFFPTPSATGPTKITADTNGALTLLSVKGIFYTSPDAGHQVGVATPGGATYVFDLATLHYR